MSEFSEIPANRFFGFQLISQTDAEAEITLPVSADHLQEGGVVHGGIISALADTTAVYALLPGLPDGRRMTGIEFKINFLAPALPDQNSLRAQASVVKQGRTIGVCKVDIFQKEKQIATGLFTYLFLEKEKDLIERSKPRMKNEKCKVGFR